MEYRDSNKEDISFNHYLICKSTPTIEDVIKKALTEHKMKDAKLVRTIGFKVKK